MRISDNSERVSEALTVSAENAIATFDTDNPYCPTAKQFEQAAEVIVAMERKEYGSPGSWKYPPGKEQHRDDGVSISLAQVLYDVGYPEDVLDEVNPLVVGSWTRSREFRNYVATIRTYRAIESLEGDYNLKSLLKDVTMVGVKSLFTKMVLADAGLAEEVPAAALLRELPRYIRLLEQMEGRLEAGGIAVNIVQTHLTQLSDPTARARAIEAIKHQLGEEIIEQVEVEELEG